jgi:hypothetical protein
MKWPQSWKRLVARLGLPRATATFASELTLAEDSVAGPTYEDDLRFLAWHTRVLELSDVRATVAQP